MSQLIYFLFFVSSFVFATPSKLKVTVTFGDKITSFELLKTGQGGALTLIDGQGAKKSREMSAEDYDFLAKKLASIPGQPNEMRFCPRKHIVIFNGEREVLACLGAQNTFAHEAQEIANLLSLSL